MFDLFPFSVLAFGKFSFQHIDSILVFPLGDPLYVGMDITIASFDAISEVNMASI